MLTPFCTPKNTLENTAYHGPHALETAKIERHSQFLKSCFRIFQLGQHVNMWPYVSSSTTTQVGAGSMLLPMESFLWRYALARGNTYFNSRTDMEIAFPRADEHHAWPTTQLDGDTAAATQLLQTGRIFICCESPHASESIMLCQSTTSAQACTLDISRKRWR
eukprot:5489814-Amphidinium_carterae.2